MKKSLILLVFVLLMVALAFGYSRNSNEPIPANQTAFRGQYIVNAQYVLDALGKENMIIVDARGEKEAKKGTVKGAIAVQWQMFARVANGNPGDDMWGTILPVDELSEALGNAGLDPDKEIIVFAAGRNGWGEDGRIAWELLAAGYSDVKMVDGGYDALVTAGAPIEKGSAAYSPCIVNIEAIDTTHVINTDGLVANYSDYTVVDMRADKEYQGQTLYGEAAGGHLPGAVQVRFIDLFNSGNTLKSNDEIIALFEAAGVSKDASVVTYCTAGIRSAYAQLVLEMCGYTKTMNYDESYYHWSATQTVE